MSTKEKLEKRSDFKCELCSSSESLNVYEVGPDSKAEVDDSIFICQVCLKQIDKLEEMNVNHWRCLNDSMWSTVPAVQVMAWRMLSRLNEAGWPQDLLDMLYLDDALLTWAKATGEGQNSEVEIKHLDSNGAVLEAGDTVTLIKDLNVKGANFTAKRGTAVRSISLVADNAEHIEGKVEGQRIVLLTKFVKKTN